MDQDEVHNLAPARDHVNKILGPTGFVNPEENCRHFRFVAFLDSKRFFMVLFNLHFFTEECEQQQLVNNFLKEEKLLLEKQHKVIAIY